MKTLRIAAVHAILVLASAATLYPVLWVVKMALSPSQGFAMSPSPLPTKVTLQNFIDVVSTHDASGWLFGRQLFNSIVVAAAVTVVGVALACSAAYALSRFRFGGRTLTLRAFFLSQMFPGVVTSIPLYVLLDHLALLNRLAGLVLVYATTAIPFCVFMLKGYFDSLPRELEEAVLLDGGTRFDAFWRVALPLSRPALAVTALFCFLTAWNEFILAFTFMTDPRSWTLPVALQRYVGDYSTEWGHFAAGAILVSLPVMALFFALERHLVGGLTQGGVKG
ncbi:MAG: putative sugar transporter permease [Myxococcales bacterium]|nr:putative sugar transporter permease [Myxococcales bacterium]